MKIFATIIVFLLPLVSLAQINQTDSNGLRQGLWKKEYPNGRLLYEGQFKNGKPVGEWKRYYEGGQTKAIIKYADDSDSAYVQLFNPLGKKIAEGNYLNKKKEGRWLLYSDGRKVAEENYTNGVRQGASQKYYDTGQLLESSEWKNGIQEGKYQVFFKSGKPSMQCKFSNNKRNGLCVTYFKNGQVELEAYYKNSLRDKDWKYYNEDGDLLYTLKYDEGKLLNPEVRDSIDNLKMQKLEKAKNTMPDPEKFIQDPTEYMRKMNIHR